MIASKTKIVLINLTNKQQKNLTVMLELEDFKNITYNPNDERFYIVANRLN